MWDIMWDIATCSLKLNCYTEYIKKNICVKMFQFTITKIHFYFKFIPMCVWVGGGGGTEQRNGTLQFALK